MKKITSAIAILSFFVFVGLLQNVNGQNSNDKPYYIEVTGTASKKVAPDKIYLSIVIDENDGKNNSLTRKEKSMIKELTSLGIDTNKDLVIKDMASVFRRYFIKGNEAKLSKDYELLVGSAKLAGEVIVKLQEIGISNVSISNIENSQIETHKNEVRAEAIRNARNMASVLAGAINQEIGKAIYIREQQSYISYGPAYEVMNVRSLAKADSTTAYEAPDVEFESIDVEINVNAQFELK